METPRRPDARVDRVRDLVMEARQGNRLLESIQSAWINPAAELEQSKIGKAGPPQQATLERVHYRPGVSARLVVALDGVKSPRSRRLASGRVYLNVQIYPQAEQARERFRLLCATPMHKTPGPPLLLLPEFQAVATCLPNSPRLRKLRYLLQPQKSRILLQAMGLPLPPAGQNPAQCLRLVRLVPRKRALFHYKVGAQGFYLKMFTKEEHRQAAKDLEQMTALQEREDLSFRVPRLVAYDKKAHLVAMDELPGKQVTSLYGIRDQALWQRCGQGLASLHRLRLPATSPTWTVAEELSAISKGCVDLRAALPEETDRIARLLDLLEDQLGCAEGFEPRAIHANLFGDQMLDDGTQLSIVDWEDLSNGDPCFDVGRLGAHLLASAVTSGSPLDQAERDLVQLAQAHREGLQDDFLLPKRLAWHLIGALLLRAKIGSLRTLPLDWDQQISRILDLAEGVRDGTLGPWRLPSSS